MVFECAGFAAILHLVPCTHLNLLDVHTDPVFSNAVSELLSTFTLSNSAAAWRSASQTIFPALSAAIVDVRREADSPKAAAAISILDNMISNWPLPLPQGIFSAVAAPVFEVLESTDDQAVLQVGALFKLAKLCY